MCGGNRRRANRYAGFNGNGNTYTAGGGLMALVNGIQQMRMASQAQGQGRTLNAALPSALPANTLNVAANMAPQTQGVVRSVNFDDEKNQILKSEKEKEDIEFEELPTYEESTELSSPRSTPSVPQAARAPAPIRAQPRQNEAVYVPNHVPVTQHSAGTHPLTSTARGLDAFNVAIQSYRSGECGGRRKAQRAARALMHELMDQERSRMEATYGPLACGARKQIRRDLKPVKAMLKGAVREARSQRNVIC